MRLGIHSSIVGGEAIGRRPSFVPAPRAARRRMLVMRPLTAALIGAVAFAAAARADVGRHYGAHSGSNVMLEASTAAGGGALTLEYDFSVPTVLALDVTVGDLARYSAIEPFLQILEADDPSESLYRIDDGTQVVFELVIIDPGLGVRLNQRNLLAPGDAVTIGTMPALHADPEWQLTLPAGELACRQVAFRLVPVGTQYQASEVFTLWLTNDPAGACPALLSECGDADGNGTITVSDGVNVLRGAAGLPNSCTSLAVCDVDANGVMSVTDGVNVLRAAAGLPVDLSCSAP